MGKIIEVRCKCGHTEEFLTGTCIMYSPMNVFTCCLRTGGDPLLLSVMRKSAMRDRALELVRNGAQPLGFGHTIMISPKTGLLYSRFMFELMLDDGTVWRPEYRESRTGAVLKDLAEDSFFDSFKPLSDAVCPECGKKGLLTSAETDEWS